jgi:hypothetical protein
VLNFPSELIFLLLCSHCTLVKSKFHMDIITVGYICFLNCSSVLLVTFKLCMWSQCNIFIFVMCHSYLVFNLFVWSLKGIMLIQSNIDDNESPWSFPHCLYRYVCKISKSDYLLYHVCLSVLLPAWNKWLPLYFHEILYLSTFQKPVTKIFQTEVVGKSKHFVSSVIFFFLENCAIYEIMWKNIQPGRPQWYGTYALHDGYLRIM